MAIDDLTTLYPGKAAAPDADYPQGRIRDESTDGAGDGTPVKEKWLNDWQGFFGALLNEGNVTADGSIDTAQVSQYLDALREAIRVAMRQEVQGYVLDFPIGRYAGVTEPPTAQAPFPNESQFGDSDRKLYQLDGTVVYEYDLPKAGNVSNPNYTGNSFDVSTEITSAEGLKFRTDGTSFYVIDTSTDIVYQYDMTAWDLSTAAYSGNSFDFSTETTNALDLDISSDGGRLYLLAGGADDTVYQYTFGTAWDASTLTYSALSKSVASETTLPNSVRLSEDEAQLFVLGENQIFLYEDAGSASPAIAAMAYRSEFMALTPPSASSIGMGFSAQGDRLLITDSADGVNQYNTGFVRPPL